MHRKEIKHILVNSTSKLVKTILFYALTPKYSNLLIFLWYLHPLDLQGFLGLKNEEEDYHVFESIRVKQNNNKNQSISDLIK